MSKSLKILLVLGFVAAQMVSGFSIGNFIDRSKRTRKVLQTNEIQRILQEVKITADSSYTIKPNPDVKEFCDDRGVPRLYLSLEQREKEQKAHGRRMEGVGELLADMINDENNTNNTRSKYAVGVLTKTRAGIAFIFGVLSLISFVLICLWTLLDCCCNRKFVVSNNADLRDQRLTRMKVFWMLVIAGLITIGLAILWVSFVGKVTGRVKEVKCGGALLYSDLIEGTEVTNSSKYVGANGLLFIVDSFILMMDSIDGLRTDGLAIGLKGLGGKSTTLKTSFDQYKTNYDVTKYNYDGSIDPSVKVTPNIAVSIKALNDGPLPVEVEALRDLADKVSTTGAAVTFFDPPTIILARQAFQEVKQNITEDYKEPLGRFYMSTIRSEKDYFKQTEVLGGVALALVVIVLAAFTAIYLVILFYNAKYNKAHWLKFLNKGIMLVQVVGGFLLLVLCILLTYVASIVEFSCNTMDGMITVPNYLNITLPVYFHNQTELHSIVKECVYKEGGGDILKAVGANMFVFDRMAQITDGMQSYRKLQSNFTVTSPEPPVGKFGQQSIDDVQTYVSGNIRGVPEAQDVVSGINKINQNGCSKDKMALNQSVCTTSPTAYSSSSDTPKQSLGNDYCITLAPAKLPSHNYLGRYTLATDTCTSGIALATGQTHLENAAKSANSFNSKASSLRSDYDSFYNNEADVMSSIKSVQSNLDNILAKTIGLVDTFNNARGTFKSTIDCRVMQRELIMLENVICFRVGEDFYNQIAVGIALGAMLIVYGWCMCCGIRYTHKVVTAQSGSNETPAEFDQPNPEFTRPVDTELQNLNSRQHQQTPSKDYS
jgi:Na+-transporting methylmalonyl-CoA/oxaloacetate decarboxylase gamma subunit